MNKKLFTLLVSVLALLTCSWSAKAQGVTYDVLHPVVNANQSGLSELTVNSINPDKYYQIELTKAQTDAPGAQAYLVVNRDQETGELFIARDLTPNLNASLWKISFKKEGVAGYVYTLTNKATGFELTFNDAKVTDESSVLPLATDVTEWQWYSDPDVSGTSSKLGFVPFYAYNHDGSKVIGLDYYGSSSEIGVKYVAKADFRDRDAASEFLQLRVVEALPIVLGADEFNSMIDASNGGKAAILKSDPKVANALFGTKITAEEVSDDALDGDYANFNLLLGAGGKYFRVAPDSTYDYKALLSNNGGFKVGFAPLVKIKAGTKLDLSDQDTTSTGLSSTTFTLDALTARYLWRATYYPTQDSLLLEPLNASSVSTYDKQSGTTWIHSQASKAGITHFFNTVNAGTAYENTAAESGNKVDKANNVIFNKLAGKVVSLIIYNNTVSGAYDETGVLTIGQEPLGIRVSFASKYNYLTRATLPTGLYFIQLASKSDNNLFRKAGKYYVDNHRGTTMFDSPTSYQNYVHMPATQWIVLQDTCHVNGGTPEVLIVNREYSQTMRDELINYFFEGQLYKDNNGNFFTIDQSYNGQVDNAGMLSARSRYGTGLSYMDTLKITLIKDPIAYSSHNGYAYIDSLNTMYNEYNLKYLTANLYGETTTDQYLSLANDSVLGINATPNLAFQLVKVFDENTMNSVLFQVRQLLQDIPDILYPLSIRFVHWLVRLIS
jgi:hypothetical protein